MNAFNRAFAVLVGLLWIAALAGVIYLMWTPGRELSIENRYMDFVFDLTISGSDRILATLIAVGAIVLGLGLIAAQAIPPRRTRAEGLAPASDERYRDLHQRLDQLQRRVDEREADRRPISPG